MLAILNDAHRVPCLSDVRRRAVHWEARREEPRDALLAPGRLRAVPAPDVECFVVSLGVRDDSGAQGDSRASVPGDSYCLARGGCQAAGWDWGDSRRSAQDGFQASDSDD
jgi:hypothetical protein